MYKWGDNINELIDAIKKGDKQAYIKLLTQFKPLIYTWLKQSKELYQKEKEDFESMAKIILYESALEFCRSKNVPFQSFYKIKLYHWYSNYRKKKSLEEISMVYDSQDCYDLQKDIIEKEKKIVMNIAIKSLTEKERSIIIKHIQGFTDEQIGEYMNLNKKTIQNYRYEIMNKLKKYIEDNYKIMI